MRDAAASRGSAYVFCWATIDERVSFVAAVGKAFFLPQTNTPYRHALVGKYVINMVFLRKFWPL
jgi:hypothetical protein